MSESRWRGHRIVYVDGAWLFADTGVPVAENPARPCGHCGKANTPEGHDGCIGTLPDAMNACCGHGNISAAYVQQLDGTCIRGEPAMALITTTRTTEQRYA